VTHPRSGEGTIALGPGREFDRIRRLAATLGPRAAGLGDDCAVLAPGEGMLVVSTDVSVEDVHFRRAWLSAQEVGWRATAAALSDLAAEGAEPAGALVGLTVPASAGDEEVEAVMLGAGDAAAATGARIVGGDLSSGAAWSVAVTVLGWAAAPVGRGGARVGDGLWLTGTLGAPRAALEAWLRGDTPHEAARRAFAHPMPRIRAGQWLAHHGAGAMIDVSDGLAADAGHIAAASGVGLSLELDRVSVAAAARPEAARLGMPVERFAAESGEEYELLAALPARFAADEARAFERACGLPLTRVGEVVAGAGVTARLGGAPLALGGYDHFGSRPR
jgi:thiamine-monophosphate kinase